DPDGRLPRILVERVHARFLLSRRSVWTEQTDPGRDRAGSAGARGPGEVGWGIAPAVVRPMSRSRSTTKGSRADQRVQPEARSSAPIGAGAGRPGQVSHDVDAAEWLDIRSAPPSRSSLTIGCPV